MLAPLQDRHLLLGHCFQPGLTRLSRHRGQFTSKRQNDEIANRDMRVVIAALLSLVALFFVLVTGTKDNYTIHIGARTPPLEAGCSQVGEHRTDEGKVLAIYSCPA